MRVMLRLLYRVEVEGLEHARAALPHAVIAANHASFLDGLLLGAFLPGEPIFAVDTLIARKWWARPFLAARQRAAGRSDQSAVDPRDDPRRRSRLGLHHLSGGAHYDDRRADEGLRRSRPSLPNGPGAALVLGAHRRRRIHAVLAPGRQGPPPLFPQVRIRVLPPRRLDVSRKRFQGARAGPRCARRCATRWSGRFRDRADRHHALRCAARGAAAVTAAVTRSPTTSSCWPMSYRGP